VDWPRWPVDTKHIEERYLLTWGCKEGTEKWNETGNVEEERKEEAQRCDDYIRRDENFIADSDQD